MIYPEPTQAELPGLLDFPPPRILCYSRESVIAEKFETMVKLGELNSRMKGFYDVCFDGIRLAEAIRLTFDRRRTAIPAAVIAFSNTFAGAKQTQWQAFHRRLQQEHVPTAFIEIVDELKIFLAPVVGALQAGKASPDRWEAPGPWAPST